MTRFERIFDAIHNFSVALARMTKPRWHFDRDRLIGLFHIGTVLVTGVSAAIPQVKGLAWVATILSALQRTAAEVQKQLPDGAAAPALEPAPESAATAAPPATGLRAVPPSG